MKRVVKITFDKALYDYNDVTLNGVLLNKQNIDYMLYNVNRNNELNMLSAILIRGLGVYDYVVKAATSTEAANELYMDFNKLYKDYDVILFEPHVGVMGAFFSLMGSLPTKRSVDLTLRSTEIIDIKNGKSFKSLNDLSIYIYGDDRIDEKTAQYYNEGITVPTFTTRSFDIHKLNKLKFTVIHPFGITDLKVLSGFYDRIKDVNYDFEGFVVYADSINQAITFSKSIRVVHIKIKYDTDLNNMLTSNRYKKLYGKIIPIIDVQGLTDFSIIEEFILENIDYIAYLEITNIDKEHSTALNALIDYNRTLLGFTLDAKDDKNR